VGWFEDPGAWLGRLAFQRLLALLYLLAFLVAANQGPALLGEHGLTPIGRYLARLRFRDAPSIFHWRSSDRWWRCVSWLGALVAFLAVVGVVDAGPAWLSMLGWAVLWWLYLSIVNVGQVWYGFGWESLLCEVGFLAIWLGPSDQAPPLLLLWLLRWVLFRMEFGAGLIKLRGDPCWRDLTCLRYHHETQPMPNPLSWWFHRLPDGLHRVEVAANHATQLVLPFGLLLPQPLAGWCALVMVATQLWLVLSGNFSWLNWLTIALGLSVAGGLVDIDRRLDPVPRWHAVLVLAVSALVVFLSRRPARNLVSRRQLMNASFDRWHLVNTYGAFGSVGKVRDEVIIAGTLDEDPAATEWREYEFKGKPGDVQRRPPQVAPYHLRLDWMLWFAALSSSYAEPWFLPLIQRLLEADAPTRRLLRTDPFDGEPPRWVKADLYRYRFTTRAERRQTGAWWHRERLGPYLRPVAASDLGRRAP
jgi:hypothetical protein